MDNSKIATNISYLRLPLAQDANLYFGNVEINIENGNKMRIDFFSTFAPTKTTALIPDFLFVSLIHLIPLSIKLHLSILLNL